MATCSFTEGARSKTSCFAPARYSAPGLALGVPRIAHTRFVRADPGISGLSDNAANASATSPVDGHALVGAGNAFGAGIKFLPAGPATTVSFKKSLSYLVGNRCFAGGPHCERDRRSRAFDAPAFVSVLLLSADDRGAVQPPAFYFDFLIIARQAGWPGFFRTNVMTLPVYDRRRRGARGCRCLGSRYRGDSRCRLAPFQFHQNHFRQAFGRPTPLPRQAARQRGRPDVAIYS